MVSVLNKKVMATTSVGLEQRIVPLGELAELLDRAQRHEREEAYFLAADYYREAGEYQKALDLYLRNVDKVTFNRAIEDAGFRTLIDILKCEVDSGALERWCDRPNFFVQDEFHSYVGAAKCAWNLGREELFRFYLNAAINIGIKRATKDKIYYTYVADCYELLGNSGKATES